MNLFINEKSWNKYAETIAIEDICELCDIFLPEEGEYIEQNEL